MSAWLCSQNHINLIVNASDNPTEEAFKMLLEENLNSLRARYGEKEIDENEARIAADFRFEPIDPARLISRVYAERQDFAQHYKAVTQEVTPARIAAQIRQSCASFDYQSCEHEEWTDTQACALIKVTAAKYPGDEKLDGEALWSF